MKVYIVLHTEEEGEYDNYHSWQEVRQVTLAKPAMESLRASHWVDDKRTKAGRREVWDHYVRDLNAPSDNYRLPEKDRWDSCCRIVEAEIADWKELSHE